MIRKYLKNPKAFILDVKEYGFLDIIANKKYTDQVECMKRMGKNNTKCNII